MATSLEVLQDRVDTLNAARQNPARSLTYQDGRRVEYRNLADLERQYARAVRELGYANGTLTRKRRTNRVTLERY